ncbi:MAG TPA: hypothetical protein VFF65_00580 [Phycisphaerales bacterium]|nr:hypothetical protein [Phycisphaerales bacterium]
MRTSYVAVSSIVLASACGSVWADVLYDTLTGALGSIPRFISVASVELSNPGIAANSVYSAFPLTVPAAGGEAGSGWNISVLEMGFGTHAFTSQPMPLAGNGRLYIFSRAAGAPLPLSADDPHSGTVLPYTYTPSAPFASQRRGTLRVEGLDLTLMSGDYWIGFAPIIDTVAITLAPQMFGVGDASGGGSSDLLPVSISPGGVQAPTTDWFEHDFGAGAVGLMAMRLTGTVVPAPGAAAVLCLAGLSMARRRR